MIALFKGAQAAAIAAHDSAVISLVGVYLGLMVMAAGLSALAKRFKILFGAVLSVTGALLAALANPIAFRAPIGAREVTPEADRFDYGAP